MGAQAVWSEAEKCCGGMVKYTWVLAWFGLFGVDG